MKEPLVVFEKELATGLHPTARARQAPFWTDGRNVVFEDYAIKAGLGQISMFITETNQALLGGLDTLQGGKRTVYFGTQTNLYKWSVEDGVTDVTNIAGVYTGDLDNLWVIRQFGEWIVATNGVDPLQLDKNGGSGFEDMTTPFSYCKTIWTTDTQLIAANTDLSPTDVEWTDVDDIENWTAASSNFAGATELRNLAGEISAIEALGTGLALYTQNDYMSMNFIGSPFVFSILPQQEGFGTVSPFGVCQKGNQNFGIGKKGLWISDGVTFQRIGSPAIHEFIYGESDYRMDLDLAHIAVAWHDQLQTAITFYYTPIGEMKNTIGVSFNYSNNAWTVLNFGRNWVSNEGVFTFAVSGDAFGNVFQESVAGEPPASGALGSMQLEPTSTVSAGFGEAGFGELGFGGELVIDG